jgi:hypothetical protein
MKKRCPICDETFRYGPDAYEGQYILAYEITTCSICYKGYWDGWGGFAEPVILAHLKAKGIEPPARNAKRLLPRDG